MKQFLCLIFMLSMGFNYSFAQKQVSGQVKDVNGEAIIGANISVKEMPSIGTITDIDGGFSLMVPEGGTILIFSYTGYQTQEVAITASPMMVSMSSGVLLNELVVVGYGEKS